MQDNIWDRTKTVILSNFCLKQVLFSNFLKLYCLLLFFQIGSKFSKSALVKVSKKKRSLQFNAFKKSIWVITKKTPIIKKLHWGITIYKKLHRNLANTNTEILFDAEDGKQLFKDMFGSLVNLEKQRLWDDI